MWPNTYPSHEHRPDDYPVTQDSIERAKAETRAERIRNGADPDTGKFPKAPIVHMPLRPHAPLTTRINCAVALDRIIETYGLRAVLCAMANVVAANGHDISHRTIHELAQGSEEQ